MVFKLIATSGYRFLVLRFYQPGAPSRSLRDFRVPHCGELSGGLAPDRADHHGKKFVFSVSANGLIGLFLMLTTLVTGFSP